VLIALARPWRTALETQQRVLVLGGALVGWVLSRCVKDPARMDNDVQGKVRPKARYPSGPGIHVDAHLQR